MKLYTLAVVEKYLATLTEDQDIMEIPGTLLDTYIIHHGHCIEILEVKYLNEWSSAYTRHIYRKRIPKRFLEWIDQEITELENQGENIVENDDLYNLYTTMVMFEDFNGIGG